MSTLHRTLEDYLRLRRTLGFKLEREGDLLPQFLSLLEGHESPYITASLAVQWAFASPSGSVKRARSRLRMVRGFAKYLAALDARHEVPSPELLPATQSPRPTPYIYTDAEICALIEATQTLHGLKAATYATLLGLLAATGMRVGEAIALNRDDLDAQRTILTVQQGKFGKARELALHRTSVEALHDYASVRDRALTHQHSPAFLLSLAGTRLEYKNVHHCFLRLLCAAGLNRRNPRPRLHDLRHTFAVATLVRWYREGVNVDARLPALSTYLGHVVPSSTYWYLTATPALLELARQRAQRRLESQP